MAKAKNVVEATITQLHKEKDGIVAIVGEEKYSELLNFFIEKNKQKHPDYIPNFRDVGRPSSNVTMDDLIKNDPLGWFKGAGWFHQYSIQEVLDQMCYELNIESKTDKFKLAIVLADMDLIQWDNIKKKLVQSMALLLNENITDSHYYQCFAKMGLSADPDEYISDFFPEKERMDLRENVDSWLCCAFERDCYDDYMNDI